MADYLPQTYSFASLEHLRAAALIHGLTSPDIDGAVVVELGCSSGAQILALARRHPKTRFIGVDYSESELSTASAHTNGLSNVEWVCANVLDWEPPARIDYLICHGFLTWVPEPVRLKVLSAVTDWLTDFGVAFFSHATPPGSAAKLLARQVFEIASTSDSSPEHRVSAGQALLDDLVQFHQPATRSYSLALSEQQRILNGVDWPLLAQDFLSADLTPLPLRALSLSGLHYVCDTQFIADFPVGLPSKLHQQWSDLGGVLQHDFLDVCLGRAFRRGLWSKQVPGELTLQLQDSEQLWFRAHYLLPNEFDLQDGVPCIIKTVVGGQFGVREGWSKQLLKILASLPELSIAEIEQHFGFQARAFLQQLIQMGAVLLSTSSRVRAIDDAVFLGPGGPENAWLEPVSLSQFEQSLYRGCLSGQVIESILQDIQLGRVELHINQQKCLDAKEIRPLLPDLIQARLPRLVFLGLIGPTTARDLLAAVSVD